MNWRTLKEEGSDAGKPVRPMSSIARIGTGAIQTPSVVVMPDAHKLSIDS
jgi:hypothetical protein